MSDPRLTPDPTLLTLDKPAQVMLSVTDLCRTPEGPRDRQLIYGETVRVLSETHGWCYVQADKDGYCGHVAMMALGPVQQATHRVSSAGTHAYLAPDLKSHERIALSHGSRLAVQGITNEFAETPAGYVPRGHLSPLSPPEADPAEVAALYLGTPYLWGGNSRAGLDCSGLIQAALIACDIPCPGDSDMQTALGAEAKPPYRRNDLLFWKGHVALVTDPETLIHANAHAMAVTYEPIGKTIHRIAEAGDGPVMAHRRL